MTFLKYFRQVPGETNCLKLEIKNECRSLEAVKRNRDLFIALFEFREDNLRIEPAISFDPRYVDIFYYNCFITIVFSTGLTQELCRYTPTMSNNKLVSLYPGDNVSDHSHHRIGLERNKCRQASPSRLHHPSE